MSKEMDCKAALNIAGRQFGCEIWAPHPGLAHANQRPSGVVTARPVGTAANMMSRAKREPDQVIIERTAREHGWQRSFRSRYVRFPVVFVRGDARLEVRFSSPGQLTGRTPRRDRVRDATPVGSQARFGASTISTQQKGNRHEEVHPWRTGAPGRIAAPGGCEGAGSGTYPGLAPDTDNHPCKECPAGGIQHEESNPRRPRRRGVTAPCRTNVTATNSATNTAPSRGSNAHKPASTDRSPAAITASGGLIRYG